MTGGLADSWSNCVWLTKAVYPGLTPQHGLIHQSHFEAAVFLFPQSELLLRLHKNIQKSSSTGQL